MPYIYSTMAAPVAYTGKADVSNNDLPRTPRRVTIAGGAGIANKNLITPLGVVTEVTDDELAFLKTDEVFNRHVERGVLVIQVKKSEVEKVAPDMVQDESSPLTPADYDEDSPGAIPSDVADKPKRGRK